MTGAIGLGVWCTALVVGRVQQGLDPTLAPFARIAEPLCLVEIALCLSVVLLARFAPASTPFVIDLGYLVNFVGALVLEFAFASVVELPGNAMRGTPWAVLFILFVPLYLPHGLWATLGWCMAFAATPLLALLLQSGLGAPLPDAVTLIQWNMGPLFAIGMVMVPVWLQRRQREDLAAAEARVRQLGSYQLGRSLGQGGMGEVWEAWHAVLPRPAAVKIIHTDPSSAERAAERFRAEAQAMSGLQSPHTVELYDFGISPDGRLFYAMERLEGADLRRIVRDTGPMEPERVAYLLAQACRSLREAHERGLVHGDIKPANLFACVFALQWDFLKVLDFGLVLRDTTGRHKVAGTPGYLAPELWLGEPATPRSDLYALGCTAWTLLVGERPFAEHRDTEFEQAHRESEPDWARLPALPEPLFDLVRALLAKAPEDRPRSAGEVQAELDAVMFDTPWTEARARGWWGVHEHLVFTDTREYTDVTRVFEVR